jgi:hypothetical protein
MALIVLQHTVVDNFDVDPEFEVTSSNRILAGTLVGLDSSGFVALAGNNGSSGVQPLGIAGDSLSDEYKTTPYSAELIVGRGVKSGSSYLAPKRYTSNRVSDFFNETLSSGKMSVYTGSGRFATDQFVVTDPWSGASGAKVYSNASGKFTTSTGTSARAVGYILKEPSEYSSGVPGTDSPTAGEGSMSLGSFLQIQLSI